jgi:hypothetical protein
VVCAARDQRSRCFAFAASPTGRLQIDVARGYGHSPPECAVDTTLAFGPDLELGLVPDRPYESDREVSIEHLGGEPRWDRQSRKPRPRTWTELPRQWTEVDATQFPALAVAELLLQEVDRGEIGVAAPPAISAAGGTLFCLRIEGAWRCSEDVRPADCGPIQVRTAGGQTVVSIADKYNHIDGGSFLYLHEVVGPALLPRGRFPLGAHSDYSRRNDQVDGDTVETATSVVQEWRYVHEAPLCIRVSGASAHREILREVPHSTTPRRSTSRREDVPIVYGAASTSLPRMAPAMASPEVGCAIPDLRGSWRLEGESWTRVSSCKAN